MREAREEGGNRIGKRSCRTILIDSILIVIWLILAAGPAWTALSPLADTRPPLRNPKPGGTNYLIVASPALETSANAWAEYRRSTGYVPDILEAAEYDFPSLREKIQKSYIDSGRPNPFFVLLLGHAHGDSTAPGAYLPAGEMDSGEFAYYLSGAETIASDSLYAARDDELHLLPIAIGRVPARDEGEALRILARVKHYESEPPAGPGRSRIDLIASDSGFGPQFDGLVVGSLEYLVTSHLPEYYQWRILYGNPESAYYVPAGDFPGEIAGRLNSGSLLAMYIGHGLMDYLGPIRAPDGSEAPAFESEDLPLIRSADGSVVALLGCLIGQYDSAGDQPSLAEELVLRPGGAAAAYAASRITSPEANAVVVKDLLTGALQDRIPDLGSWIARAESAFLRPAADRALWMAVGRRIIPELHKVPGLTGQYAAPDIPGELHYNLAQHAYNLFGDPALRIAYAVPDLTIRPAFAWVPRLDRVSFSAGGLAPGGSATIVLLAPPGHRWQSDIDTGSEPQANDRTVAERSVSADTKGNVSGQLDLPAGLPSGRYILKVEAVDAGTTRVGSRTVYLGLPPVGVVFASVYFWWGMVTVVLLWRFIHPLDLLYRIRRL